MSLDPTPDDPLGLRSSLSIGRVNASVRLSVTASAISDAPLNLSFGVTAADAAGAARAGKLLESTLRLVATKDEHLQDARAKLLGVCELDDKLRQAGALYLYLLTHLFTHQLTH